jgi:parallel beta-helix repeat protein
VLEENVVEFSRWVGIAIEHGHDNRIHNNRIRLNGEGIRLWTRSAKGQGVMPYWSGYEVSYNHTVEDNLFEGNRVGFSGYTADNIPNDECHGFHLRGNTFRDNRIGAHFARVFDCTVEGNTFENNVEAALQLVKQPHVRVEGNQFVHNGTDIAQG